MEALLPQPQHALAIGTISFCLFPRASCLLLIFLNGWNDWNALNSWNQRLLSRFTMGPEVASISCYLSIAVYRPGIALPAI
jgi:hypothetical protein